MEAVMTVAGRVVALRRFGPGVRVIKQDRGVFDTFPMSLLTTQAVAGLGRLARIGPYSALTGHDHEPGSGAGRDGRAGRATGW
jgi:hypothetical protein